MNPYFHRRLIIQTIIFTALFILIARIFYIQIIDTRYIEYAEKNAIRKEIIYPTRGVIYDRNGKIMVQNEPVYDLMVVPKTIDRNKGFDTLLMCSLIDISKERLIRDLKKAKAYSNMKASIIEKQLSNETYARLQEHLFLFPGFFVQSRTLRKYPYASAPHVLGYIGEASEKKVAESNGEYQSGDYLGISGIELSYEKQLRGIRGVRSVIVDALNRTQGSLQEGAYDTVALAGEKMITSLDAELQLFGEQLMQNKMGSVVAIEPSTGEILAFISAPAYDPNMLVGRMRGNNYMKLLEDPLKPLFIRPIQAQYPPGSIFKPVQALIAQQLKLVSPSQRFPCGGGYSIGNHVVKCTHVHAPLNMEESIQHSCNAYYCWIFKAMIDQNKGQTPEQGYNIWRSHIEKFGIGVRTEVDLPSEVKGLLPTYSYYDKIYGSGSWKSSTIISLAIGQGELGITPLQMANVMAAIANHGYYYKPHLVKAIGNDSSIKSEYTEKISVGIDEKYFPLVVDGMEKVVTSGTATFAQINGIPICGKTGTAQNPNGKDHSIFMGFAPKENPKIAIAVVVENAGFGSTWAAPIASLMIEKYLRDTITRNKWYVYRIMDANLLPNNNPNIPVAPAQKVEAKTKPVEATITPTEPKKAESTDVVEIITLD